MRTDAELYSVMQKACLLPKEQPRSPSPAELRFNLDSEVGDEGQHRIFFRERLWYLQL